MSEGLKLENYTQLREWENIMNDIMTGYLSISGS